MKGEKVKNWFVFRVFISKILFPAALILTAFTPGIVCGQDEDASIDPDHLLEVCDEEIFIREGIKQTFWEDQGYVNEFPNPVTVHQYYIYDNEGSDMLMTMEPSAETIRTTNKRLKFDWERQREFHVTYSVARKEDIPAGGGGMCWLGYNNFVMQGIKKDSGVILYPGGNAYFFSHDADGEIVYESIADLSDLDPDDYNKFDFIRLDGITYFYVNGKFRFSYDDGIKDVVTFEGGAELSKSGNRIRCTFDDYSMRHK